MTERIVLVDDDNHILTSVSVSLKNEGFDRRDRHGSTRLAILRRLH